MRQLAIFVLGLFFVTNAAFAQEKSTVATKEQSKPPAQEQVKESTKEQPKAATEDQPKPSNITTSSQIELKIAIGRIESLVMPKPEKKIRAKVVITAEDNTETAFYIFPGATIYDKDAKIVGLNQLKKGEKIQVKYYVSSTKENNATAISIFK